MGREMKSVAEATWRLHVFVFILSMLSPVTFATTDQRFSTSQRRIFVTFILRFKPWSQVHELVRVLYKSNKKLTRCRAYREKIVENL